MSCLGIFFPDGSHFPDLGDVCFVCSCSEVGSLLESLKHGEDYPRMLFLPVKGVFACDRRFACERRFCL